jgi:hypothetical protein
VEDAMSSRKPMRLDSVEIKVTFDHDVDGAVEKLNLPSDRPRWNIYFCEDVIAGTSSGTPLLDARIVLRAREKPAGRDDTTIKLRPCRRSQLTDHWLGAEEGNDWEFKVEADWAGDRRMLAASHTVDRSEGFLAAHRSDVSSVSELFSKEQRDFLRDCAGSYINVDTLTVLPPVTATRWDPFRVEAGSGLKVRAERWNVDHLDFLELSIVADLDEAEEQQEALSRYVESLGLTVSADQDSKTRRVVNHLVQSSLARHRRMR